MVGVANPSFEDGDAYGAATSWTLTSEDTAFEWVEYYLPLISPAPRAYEGFEEAWLADPFVDEFVGGSTVDAEYGSIYTLAPKYVEDFNESWNNTPWLTELASLEAATYMDSSTVDGFEEWGLFKTAFAPADLEDAPFAGSGIDTFDGWGVLKDTFTEGVDTTTALFRVFNYEDDQETFEAAYHVREVMGDASTNKILSTAHGYINGLQLRLEETEGTLPAPLNEVTAYFVRDKTADDFKLELTVGSSAIDLTTSSIGHQTAVPDESNVWTQFLGL